MYRVDEFLYSRFAGGHKAMDRHTSRKATSATRAKGEAHVLLGRRLDGAFAFVSLPGVGIGLVAIGHTTEWIGTTLSFLAAVLTLALYLGWPPFAGLKRFRRVELMVAATLVFMEVGVPIYMLSSQHPAASVTQSPSPALPQAIDPITEGPRASARGTCSPAVAGGKIDGNLTVTCSVQ
jgi:hypothetical protein